MIQILEQGARITNLDLLTIRVGRYMFYQFREKSGRTLTQPMTALEANGWITGFIANMARVAGF